MEAVTLVLATLADFWVLHIKFFHEWVSALLSCGVVSLLCMNSPENVTTPRRSLEVPCSNFTDNKTNMSFPTFPVLYNTCYGGFTISDLAIHEYRVKKGIIEEQREYDEFASSEMSRTDPIMVEVCRKLGHNSWGTYSKLKVAMVPEIYKDHYYITEYDGKESVVVDYDKYRVAKIKEVLGTSMQASTKEEMIASIIQEEDLPVRHEPLVPEQM